MITNVLAKNFMGQTFNQRLAKKNLFVGPMGSGKSSRAMALELTRNGSARGMKSNPDLFRAFGPPAGSAITIFYVGIIIDDKKRIERKYQRSRKGVVSEKFQLNGSHNVGKELFFDAMAGAPQIFNVSAFMALSDKKMIDAMFRRFPPSDPKVLKVDADIARKETEQNEKMESIRAAEKIIQRLTTSKAEQKIPAGNLPQIQSDIAETKLEISQVQKNIHNLELKAAADSAKQKAEAEQKVREAAAAEQKTIDPEKEKQAAGAMEKAGIVTPTPKAAAELEKYGVQVDPLESDRRAAEQRLKDRAIKSGHSIPAPVNAVELMAIRSIKKIIDAMATTGCDVCAAFLIGTLEMKKFETGRDEKNG